MRKFGLVQAQAEQGNVNALFEMGQAYRLGLFVEQDYDKAAEYLSKAANKGHSDAQNSLGLLFQKGLGVVQSFGVAKQWFEASAEQR